jgi:L-malate glycosyltransferase
MKILLLARANYLLAARRADLLRDEGHDVLFLSAHTNGSLTEAEALFGRGPMPLRLFASVPTTRLAIRKFKPDLIDAHGATSYGALAALAARDTPWILTLYGTDVYFQARRNPLLKFIASQSLRHADLLYGSSSAVFEDVRALVDNRDIETCIFHPWGIPLGEPVTAEEAQRTRHERGTPPSSFVAIHPRRLSSHWRVDWIVDRLKELALSSEKRVELWLVYPPPSTRREQMLLDELLQQAKGGLVTIRPLGHLPHRELMVHLAAADAFVCAARNEMLASSFLESMYHGAIPVVTRVPAFEEASKWEGATVSLANQNDPEAFLSALRTISEYDPSTRRRVNEGNRKAVRSRADERECLRSLLASASIKLGLEVSRQ